MKMIRPFLNSAALLLPVVTLAGSDSDFETGSRWDFLFDYVQPFFTSLIPVILFFGLLFWFVRRQSRSPLVQRQQQYLLRSELHMERMEALLERLVAAMEQKPKASSHVEPDTKA